MGGTTSCCVPASPKRRRNAHARLESFTEPEISREDSGCNLQHISDRENVDGKVSRYTGTLPLVPGPRDGDGDGGASQAGL